MVERFDKLVSGIADAIVNPLIALMFGVALVVFLWGVFQWIYHADDSKEREAGKNNILYAD